MDDLKDELGDIIFDTCSIFGLLEDKKDIDELDRLTDVLLSWHNKKVLKEHIPYDKLEKMFRYIMSGKQGSFRYIVYDVMGYKPEDYSWWYSTGLMGFKDWIAELQDENRKLKQQLKKESED